MQKYIFSPQLRIKTGAQYKNVFSRGRRFKTSCCTIFYTPNELGYSRLGVVAAKKHIKLAVKRNIFKRVARESFRLQQPELHIPSLDIVVFAITSSAVILKSELRKCLDQSWLKFIERHNRQVSL